MRLLDNESNDLSKVTCFLSRQGHSIIAHRFIDGLKDVSSAEKDDCELPLRTPRLCGAIALLSVRGNERAFGPLDTRRRRRAARGWTLAAAIVSLMVIMLFAGIVVRALSMRHHVSRSNERQLQSLFFAEAAAERAKTRLLAEPGFSGETWRVSLDERGRTREAVADIRVLPVDGQTQQRRIEIETRWPDDPVHRVLRKKELIIQIPDAGAAS